MWNCSSWGAGLPFGMGNFFMGFGPFGGLLGLFILVFVIYLIAKLAMSLFSNSKADPDKQDSLAILKNRFAKGDITQEEYKRMKEILAG